MMWVLMKTKKIDVSKLTFAEITKPIKEAAKKAGMKESDIDGIIKRFRKSKNKEKYRKKLLEDLEFARRSDKAWKRYEKGKFTSLSFDEFIKEMKKW